MIDIQHPDLRTQFETGIEDPLIRKLYSIRSYVSGSRFESIVNNALKNADVDLKSINYKNAKGSMPPNLVQNLDTALADICRDLDINDGDVHPLTEPIDYKFTTNDGPYNYFELDPDISARRTVKEFERAINKHPDGEEIQSQFMPTFKTIRKQMIDNGWDKKQASPHATLLTIQKLADAWFTRQHPPT